ncbi:hypothetical protein IM25_02905 [Rhodococcus sp. p52]|nr:hypothetical protein IM25_02905 [Rhodococcus sp. p52]
MRESIEELAREMHDDRWPAFASRAARLGASRDVIGQAKGVLMERFGLDAESAFEMLRRLSQERNQLVRDLAVEVVETARPPRER